MSNQGIFRFSKYEQILSVAAELLRAKKWENYAERHSASLERALQLIDTLLKDPKWRDNFYFLLNLREEVAKAYLRRQKVADILKIL